MSTIITSSSQIENDKCLQYSIDYHYGVFDGFLERNQYRMSSNAYHRGYLKGLYLIANDPHLSYMKYSKCGKFRFPRVDINQDGLVWDFIPNHYRQVMTCSNTLQIGKSCIDVPYNVVVCIDDIVDNVNKTITRCQL